jgi:2-oxoglutarate dehydrogenase E2 component (dihydrolipoamide succinyltransferase)
MAITLKVPSVGESIQEATVGVWKKAEGDFVTVDEPLVEIESEKATLEVAAPGTGLLKKIVHKQGDTVAIGDVLAEIDDTAKASDGGGAAKEKAAKSAPAAPKSPAPGAASAPSAPVANGSSPVSTGVPAAARAVSASAMAPAVESPVRASPATRKMMLEAGLSAADVAGGAGRVEPGDVQRALDARKGGATAGAVVARAATGSDELDERVVPMTQLRKTIARRLVEAKNTAAMLTTFNEIDMTNVMALREKYQERFTKAHGIKLGFMSFFAKAAIEALRAFPAVNAEIRGTDIVYKDHYDIGVAVGGGKGLVVPVVRGADRMSFAELEKTVASLGARAKDNKLQMADLEGGTFTISNGGIYGSMMSTPILNPPQSGILGLHAIQKRAVVIDDAVVVRPMMYVALSYDHRIVDGREAVQFLVKVKDCVETPERILLEV